MMRRVVERYPSARARCWYLSVTFVVTVTLYYELFVPTGVSTKIMASFGVSFGWFLMVALIGNFAGAFAALAAGAADRRGRASFVVVGLWIAALLVLAMPLAPNATVYLILCTALNMVEGMVLVATPALVRDFSPQIGRATAMGLWSTGPILGSFLVAAVASATLDAHPDWGFQFQLCGVVGIMVAALATGSLRELSPSLRNQLMVTTRDRALVEARANVEHRVAAPRPEFASTSGLTVEPWMTGRDRSAWHSVLTVGIGGSALAFSIFQLFYFAMVGPVIVYFTTVFGLPLAEANGLLNWYWIPFAVTLIAAGALSDRLLVRKPFLVAGAAVAAGATACFAALATRPNTTAAEFAAVLAVEGMGIGVVQGVWLAGFTEAVERRNPAAVATGLAVNGWTVRMVVSLVLLVFPQVIASTTALSGDQPDGVANPELAGEWQNWWMVCLGAQLLFVVVAAVSPGYWRTRVARVELARHDAAVRAELAELGWGLGVPARRTTAGAADVGAPPKAAGPSRVT